MTRAVIGLGANLGSREAFLRAAIALLEGGGERVLEVSGLYLTAPVGPPQPDYLNAAVAVETARSPEALLGRTQAIEAELGRERAVRWGPRTVDLDLLHLDGVRRETPLLRVPHPELPRRPFALAPLLDVAPDLAGAYRDALEGGGGRPPSVPWGAPLDEADRLAAGLASDLVARSVGVRSARVVTAADPAAWRRAARGVPGAARGGVVERIHPGEVVGRVLVEGRRGELL